MWPVLPVVVEDTPPVDDKTPRRADTDTVPVVTSGARDPTGVVVDKTPRGRSMGRPRRVADGGTGVASTGRLRLHRRDGSLGETTP